MVIAMEIMMWAISTAAFLVMIANVYLTQARLCSEHFLCIVSFRAKA